MILGNLYGNASCFKEHACCLYCRLFHEFFYLVWTRPCMIHRVCAVPRAPVDGQNFFGEMEQMIEMADGDVQHPTVAEQLAVLQWMLDRKLKETVGWGQAEERKRLNEQRDVEGVHQGKKVSVLTLVCRVSIEVP